MASALTRHFARRAAYSSRKGPQGRRSVRLGVEPLEDRTVPSTFVVNVTNDTPDIGPGDGLALDAAGNTSLRAAIMEANALPGDHVIQLSGERFLLTLIGAGEDAAASADLDVSNTTGRLTIVGVGRGQTIIDASGYNARSPFDPFPPPTDRIFDVHPGAALELRGLTVTGGRAIRTTFVRQGQIVHIDGLGGGIRNREGSLTIADCELSDNLSFNDAGGAIFNTGTLTVSNSTISSGWGWVTGGGIYNSGYLDMRDSTLSNYSVFHGRIMAVGGGIYNTGTLMITNSTLSDNVTSDVSIGSGGGIHNEGRARIVSTTIAGNSSRAGGGIANSGELEIVNSTISRNAARRGAGLFVGGNATLSSTTIAGNTASVVGGGVLVSGTLALGDTLIADNVGGEFGGPDFSIFPGSAVVSRGYNLIGDTSGLFSTAFFAPTDLLNMEARLGPLQDNGGPTLTHALLQGSPAIDAGDPQFVPPPAFDQRGAGFARVVDGNLDGVARIDIGAFEFRPPFVPVKIDVKPGSDPNSINLNANGVLPVAILSTQQAAGEGIDFDAATVVTSDLTTMRFGDVSRTQKVSPLRSAWQDVDADGDIDLILHFSLPAIWAAGAMQNDTVQVEIVALSLAGTEPVIIRGTDSVRIVGTRSGSGADSANTICSNAAGWGWFVDPTPSDDSEFTTPGNQGEQNCLDLLTALTHEIGHLLGHDHEEDGVMIDTLATGIRRMPGGTEVNDWSAFLDVLLSQPLSKRTR